MDKNMEVKNMLSKAFSFNEFKMFINDQNELIVIPKINAYFSLENVKTELDFKCKIVERLSYYTASNHWYRYWSPRMIKFINYMLDTDFNKEQMNMIYCRLGNGVHHKLTVDFIKSGCELNVIKNKNCKGCEGCK